MRDRGGFLSLLPLLLQIRTRVLNGDWEDVFRRWYPGFRAYTQPVFA